MARGAMEPPPPSGYHKSGGEVAPGEGWRPLPGWALPCVAGGEGQRKRLISASCYYGILFS